MSTQSQSSPGEKRWLVFISHAGTDTWVAKQMKEQIEALGAATFLDEAHVAAGEDFEERILEALDQASELLVLLTPWSLSRPYVWAEIGAVWGKRKPIVAVLYGLTPEEIQAQPAVPIFLKRRDLININQFDQYLSQLRARIEKLTG